MRLYIYKDDQLRFYSKKEDYNNEEEQFKEQEDTSNMLKVLADITTINLKKASEMFDSVVDAKHSKGKIIR